jgi:hypothetical protein
MSASNTASAISGNPSSRLTQNRRSVLRNSGVCASALPESNPRSRTAPQRGQLPGCALRSPRHAGQNQSTGDCGAAGTGWVGDGGGDDIGHSLGRAARHSNARLGTAFFPPRVRVIYFDSCLGIDFTTNDRETCVESVDFARRFVFAGGKLGILRTPAPGAQPVEKYCRKATRVVPRVHSFTLPPTAGNAYASARQSRRNRTPCSMSSKRSSCVPTSRSMHSAPR